MTSPSFIKTKLVNYTEAAWCQVEVKNNRYYYKLAFSNSIGWDWVKEQIYKASSTFDVAVEPYEILPESGPVTCILVREVGHRPDIDDSQHSLRDFEQ